MRNSTKRKKKLLGRIAFAEELDTAFAAVTFAEAGEFEAARDLVGGSLGDHRRDIDHRAPGVCTDTG